MQNELYLYEEVLLLALQDEKGSVDWKAGNLGTVLGGALIAELLLHEKITLAESQKQTVQVLNSSPMGEAVLDEALIEIQSSAKVKPIQHWVSKLSGIPKLMERIARGLCSKGILKETEEKVLLFFKTKRYPEINPEPERALIERLRKAIYAEVTEVDLRTTLLLSLTYNSNLLAIPFSSSELRANKHQIESIIKGDKIGEATTAVIQAIQTAIIVATVVPIVVSS